MPFLIKELHGECTYIPSSPKPSEYFIMSTLFPKERD
jgi:hypothetical protein